MFSVLDDGFAYKREEIAVTYRSTFIYLLVVIFFLGFYLFETRREEKQKKGAETMKTLFAFPPEALTRLSLSREKQEIIVEKKDGGDWTITSPVPAPVDLFALTRMQNTLAFLKYLRIISEDPRDLSEFGLDPPNFVISYRIGDKEGSLAFGSRSAVEDGFYARTDANRTVYLIWSPDKRDLEKSLFDLRDKSLITLQRDQVERFVIERSGRMWTLHKIEGRWYLLGQEDLPIDQEKVGEILSNTLAADALSFVQERPDDLTPYGLDRPEARLVFSGDDRTEEILYGAHVEERAVYAKIGEKPEILLVPERLLDVLPETFEDLEGEEKEESKP